MQEAYKTPQTDLRIYVYVQCTCKMHHLLHIAQKRNVRMYISRRCIRPKSYIGEKTGSTENI